MEELVGLERRGWEALSAGGAAAHRFYDDVLADEVVMLLPGGLLLDDRAQILDSMGGVPWASFELSQVRVVRLAEDVAAVVYRADARRDGQQPYAALIASTYRRVEGRWRLAVHQHSPI